MIAIKKTICFILLVILAGSCSGKARFWQPSDNFEPLYGSSDKGVGVSHEGNSTRVFFSRIPLEGVFLRVELGTGWELLSQSWEGAEDVVHLAVTFKGGIELGVVPLKSYQGTAVSATLVTGVSKDLSIPPVGAQNVISDLVVTDVEAGQVLLEWTQVNVGDYDLNGEVNLSDITPIVLNFQDTYELLSPAALADPLYWIDGKHDGEINLSDITPIGMHYGSTVRGYNIRQNGALLPGSPTVLATEGTSSGGLPNRYSVVLPGLLSDSWSVTAVDHEGIEGADSDGNTGPLELLANIDISGQLLLDLDGSNPGGLTPDKITGRIIENIEDVDSVTIGDFNVTLDTGTFEVFNINVSPNRTVYFQVIYLPSIDLATGGNRVVSGYKGGSQVAENFLEIATIPVKIPGGLVPVVIDANIDLGKINPDGGFFVHLDTAITYPGDDPSTPEIETQYTESKRIRLDVFNSLVAVDTDGNGDFEDEAELEDDDHDCLSSRSAEQENDDYEYDDDERDEIEIEGVISAFDEAAGMITLINAEQDGGEPIEIPVPWTLFFSENTQFEEKVKVDGGDDIERNIDPSTLQVGDKVEVELYLLEDNDGLVPTKYWIEKIERRVEE